MALRSATIRPFFPPCHFPSAGLHVPADTVTVKVVDAFLHLLLRLELDDRRRVLRISSRPHHRQIDDAICNLLACPITDVGPTPVS